MFNQIKRLLYWLPILIGWKIRITIIKPENSFADRLRYMKKHQKNCTGCGRKFDWWHTSGAWADKDNINCGCKTPQEAWRDRNV